MKINNDKPVTGPERPIVPDSPPPAAAPADKVNDKVSLGQSREAAQSVESAKAATTGSRASRLRAIEDAVRNGAYKPNASRVADDILLAAEIEAHLRQMLGG